MAYNIFDHSEFISIMCSFIKPSAHRVKAQVDALVQFQRAYFLEALTGSLEPCGDGPIFLTLGVRGSAPVILEDVG